MRLDALTTSALPDAGVKNLDQADRVTDGSGAWIALTLMHQLNLYSGTRVAKDRSCFD